MRLDVGPPFLSIPLSLQRRMSVRMDSSSATTGGVYPPSGGATTMTTARTTATKKTVVSAQISEVFRRHVRSNTRCVHFGVKNCADVKLLT